MMFERAGWLFYRWFMNPYLGLPRWPGGNGKSPPYTYDYRPPARKKNGTCWSKKQKSSENRWEECEDDSKS